MTLLDNVITHREVTSGPPRLKFTKIFFHRLITFFKILFHRWNVGKHDTEDKNVKHNILAELMGHFTPNEILQVYERSLTDHS